MQLWLYLHFPTLQLDSLFAEHGGQPIAIVDDKTHRIVQANSVALEQGILLDMGLGSAATLCSNLKVHPYDHQVEIKALQEIAQKLYLITADIMLSPPQGILLKATDMLTLYQGLESYWQVLTHSLDGLNMAYHFATGFSPLSAQLLAQAANNQLLHERSSILEQIKHQPISEADITQKHLELLQRLGVKTVGDLLAIPLPDIARRFDIELVNYIGKLTGQFKHVIDFYTPPEHFESDLELLFDINNVQWLEKPLAILLTRLEHFLRPRNRVAYELQLSLHLRDSPPNAITFTSACGYDKAAKWQTLCQLSLESLTLKSPVQGLTLETSRTGEMQATNSDLFSKRHEQQNELELVSYLQAKLGADKVQKVALSGDPRPEHATYLYNPASLQTPVLPLGKSSNINRLRPSFLLPTPKRLHQKARIIYGPERLVTGWWDGNEIVRDYFVARNASGQWLWVFRNLKQQWYLHGYFS